MVKKTTKPGMSTERFWNIKCFLRGHRWKTALVTPHLVCPVCCSKIDVLALNGESESK